MALVTSPFTATATALPTQDTPLALSCAQITTFNYTLARLASLSTLPPQTPPSVTATLSPQLVAISALLIATQDFVAQFSTNDCAVTDTDTDTDAGAGAASDNTRLATRQSLEERAEEIVRNLRRTLRNIPIIGIRLVGVVDMACRPLEQAADMLPDNQVDGMVGALCRPA